MSCMTQAEAIDIVFNELESMAQDEFEQAIGKYKNDPLARMLMYAKDPNCFDEPLGYEFEKVLNDNRWNLYEA